MSDLNDDISEAIGIISLLLVFAVALFSATWPQMTTLLEEPIPSVARDKAKLVARLKGYQRLMAGLGVLVIAILALISPLALRVMARLEWGSPYDTLRAGLLLVLLLLLLCLGLAANGWSTLRDRIRKMS